MTRNLQAGVLSLLIGLAANFANADLLTNGSFENGLTAWTSTGNMAVRSDQGETDGTNALAFSWGNVPSNGVLTQSFDTIAGTSYYVFFDFGKYSINQPNQVARLDVDVMAAGGGNLLHVTVTDATPGVGDANSTDSPDVYSSFLFSFEALDSSSTLRFADVSDPQVGGGGFDAMLDNVVVTVVPEPSSLTIAALGVGVLAVGVILGRCRGRPRRATAGKGSAKS